MRMSVLFLGIIGMSALLNGCMTSKHGMAKHGNDPGALAHGRQFGKVIKELVAEDLALSLEVPPLSTGQAATLVVRVSRITDETAISGARVTLEIRNGEHHGEDRPEHNSAMVAERAAQEVAATGEYRLRFVFEESGHYRITARVNTGDQESPHVQSVSMTQEVREEAKRIPRSWLILGGIMAVKVGLLLFVL